MRKLFSGNADVVAVLSIVIGLGLASGVGHGFSHVRQVHDRVMTRVPARMQRIPERMQRIPDRLQRIPVRLRLAEFRERHPVLKHVICER